MLALGPDRQVWFPCGARGGWGVGDVEGLLALSIYPSVRLSVCLVEPQTLQQRPG